MRLTTSSVRLRLTLWYVVVLAAIILAFAFGTYFFVRESLLNQVNNHLSRDFATVQRVAEQGERELVALTRHGNVSLFRVTADGTLLVETERWGQAGLGDVAESGERGDSLTKLAADGERYRLRRGEMKANGKSLRIMVAHDEESLRQSLRSLAMILLLGIPAALLFAVAGGYFLASRALSPIGAMAAKAKEINAERLSERLPVENPNDEFGQLALVFNDTFLRLEDSFERLRRFTADASHELRTPLTAIRSVGEVGMQESADVTACREVLGSMLEETDRLTRLVDSLLTLSRADAGSVVFTRERTDLAALTTEVAECLQVLAEEKAQTLIVSTPAPRYSEVDRTTLRQALINLLDNAIKHTPERGQIQVDVGSTALNESVIAVSDNGPGIAPEHWDKIYERFYRVDKGRSREVGGAGLGLSIARWAVEANQGRLELVSSEGRGCTFRIVLPGLS